MPRAAEVQVRARVEQARSLVLTVMVTIATGCTNGSNQDQCTSPEVRDYLLRGLQRTKGAENATLLHVKTTAPTTWDFEGIQPDNRMFVCRVTIANPGKRIFSGRVALSNNPAAISFTSDADHQNRLDQAAAEHARTQQHMRNTQRLEEETLARCDLKTRSPYDEIIAQLQNASANIARSPNNFSASVASSRQINAAKTQQLRSCGMPPDYVRPYPF
jgi:hypothetical protein